jgi:hypothetical protein
MHEKSLVQDISRQAIGLMKKGATPSVAPFEYPYGPGVNQ